MKPVGVTHPQSLGYALLALPLAFVALPMYVNLPHLYAVQYAVPLALLGGVLLSSRLVDACIDPFIGQFSDWLYAKSSSFVIFGASLMAIFLSISFAALFHPPSMSGSGFYAAWVGVWVTACHLAYSALSILHQAWATRLGGGPAQQSRLLAWREGACLWGVVTAAMLPALVGWKNTTLFLAAALAVGLIAWQGVLRSAPPKTDIESPKGAHKQLAMSGPLFLMLPLKQSKFVKLLFIFMLNGIASAIPASLVMFFVEDQIRATSVMAPWFLGVYFLSGALSLPLWLYAIQRFNLQRTWLAGMLLAVVSFVSVSQLGAGDELAFFAVCFASGAALGADLVVPGALLNGLVDHLGQRGKGEGLYLGWWNLATKLNLALAAGLSLPLLAWWGYVPGTHQPEGLAALSVAYGLFPCALKLCAALALYVFWIRTPHPLPLGEKL